MTKTDIHKKAMVDALVKELGIVTDACKSVGIARQTHYEWYKEDPEYRKVVDDIANVALDFAESMLYEKIRAKDTTAIIFYLKTKGKGRGYIERSELTGKDGKDLASVVKIEIIENKNQVNPDDTGR